MFPTWVLTLLLGIIVIAVVMLKPKRGQEDAPESSEQALASLVDQWERENDALVRTIEHMRKDIMTYVTDIEKRLAALEEQNEAHRPAFEPDAKSAKEHLRDRYADIYELKEHGASMAEIAKKTGKDIGEVRLILGLASRRASS